MTRHPRPKYPSDQKNYHEQRCPGCAHTIRLPEDLLPMYQQLKRSLGSRSTHADKIQRKCDPETMVEAGRMVGGRDDEVHIVNDSQVHSNVTPASNFYKGAVNGFWGKSKISEFFMQYIVCCPTVNCGRKFLPPKISEFQQLWSLQMKCPSGHTFSYLSGDLEKNHGTPDITGRLYHSSLCSGMTHVCLESLCEELGLYVPRRGHFFDFQSGKKRKPGWIAAAIDLWQEQKDKIQEELLRAGKPLVVYVDCRFDSSRSGFHGTLPVINMEDDRVIEMVTLTRKETGSSWRNESTALEQALTALESKGLILEEVVHDDNSQVDAILNQHNIVSQKDLWHKCKNIMGKFKELLQEKRRSPTDSTVEAATTIAQVAVFSMAQLKEYCRQQGLLQSGNKLQLVQCVSVHLNLEEAGANTEIQRHRPLRYHELAAHDIAYKLKSWIYTCAKNAAKRGDTTPEKCVVENWGVDHKQRYVPGGETHLAVKDFLRKYITEGKMKFYLRARENFISETYHSVINKFATKRIHFDASHCARLACSALDWNENIRREVRAVYSRASNDTAVRRRPKTNRVLVKRTTVWKTQLASRVFS
ncbi:hypothetical protein R1sor_005036 [Riccia sorocarpa]|uniref:SAP domain-containing protein n=1 Tax=Riccia sorocarpa TaxID=122646 RepID=A0ABD3HMP7_9MARC